jgi:D-aminopeptidase
MRRIRLNLRSLSVTDKIAKGRHIVTSITNNATFPTPNPPLTEVTAALEELDKAQAAVQAAKSEVATRVLTQDGAETKVNLMLTQLAGYVESVAGTDDALISSIGMETKASRATKVVP